MKVTRLITATLFIIFLFNTTYSLSYSNNNLSKNNVEQARSIFKQIEKGNWKYAIRKSKKTNNIMLEQLVYWLYLNKKMNNATFNDYQDFIKQNPKIPKINRLKYLSEHKLNIKLNGPKFIINYFKKNEPLSSYGKIKLGEALIDIGNSTEGKKLIKSNFKSANLGNQDILYLTKTYKNTIRLSDIINRAEWLAWENKTRQLKHLFHYLPKDYRALHKAKYLLMTSLGGVDFAIRNVPDKYKNNQGLLYQRIRWKLKAGKIDSALKLLLKIKKDSKNFNRPNKFWKLTSTIIRHQIYKKNYLVAYLLASQHYLKQGSEYAEAEWLSGWIALKFINEPVRALNHFLNMAKSVYDPKSRSRAAYWCGKSYEMLNQPHKADEWYLKSSTYLTTYYGQLSFQKRFPHKKTSLSSPPVISKKMENDFNSNQWVQAVKILKAVNKTYFAKNILDYLSTMENKAENEFLAARLAIDIGRKDYAIRIAKRASYQKRYYNNLNYPTLKVPKIVANKKMPPAELILAVIRQESEFNVIAQSSKGALGLMQIMPDTARDVAKKTRVWYNAGKLLRDQKYNINLGSYYLQMMLGRYEGSYPLALAAYNAGHRRVDRWLKINGDPRKNEVDFSHWIELIPFKETRDYVQKVLANVNVYKFILTKQPIKLSIL